MNYGWFAIVFCLVWAASHPVQADFELQLNKGLAAYYRGNYEEAVKLTGEALTENPQSATANHILGLSLLRLGRYGESVTYLEKANSLDPDIKGIHLDLGTAYLGGGDLNRALAEFEGAVAESPESGVAYYSLGYTHFRLGNYQEAIGALEQAHKLDPDLRPQSYFYAGLSRYRLTEYSGAKSDLESVLTFGPGTDLAAPAREYLDTIARLTRKYYGTVSLGFQYDDNVVLEPNEIEITDEDDVRGVFFINLGYKPYLKPDAVIGGDYRAYFSFHKDLDELNIQNHRFNLYGEKRVSLGEKPVALSLDYFYDLVLIDGSPADDLFSQTHSGSPRVLVQWTKNTSTEFVYQIRHDNFEDFSERDAVNNNFTVAQIFRLCEGRLYVKPGFNFAVNSADNVSGTRNFDYVAPRVFAEALTFLPFGLTVLTDAYYFREDYYNDQFDRVDNQIGVRIVLSKRLYRIFFLDLGFQHISNFSASDFPGSEPFEYHRNIFSTAFSARF